MGNQALVQAGGIAYGGGLYLANDTSVSQSTITGNGALAPMGGQGFGGGIAFPTTPRSSLQKVDVRGNRATTSGPDLYRQLPEHVRPRRNATASFERQPGRLAQTARMRLASRPIPGSSCQPRHFGFSPTPHWRSRREDS